MKQPLKRRSITLTDSEWEWVKQTAEKQSITACQYVRQWIRKLMYAELEAEAIKDRQAG